MSYSRREFFTKFGRSMASTAVESLSTLRQGITGRLYEVEEIDRTGKRAAWVRPPGALVEREFFKTCTQCTDCQTACPYMAIRRLGPEFGKNSGTPAIIPTESPCYLCEDMPCIAACELKALVSVDRHSVDMGTAVIDMETCYLANGQPCDYCVTKCPIKDTAIEFGKCGLPVIHDEACAGCGVCAYLCPSSAIQIVPATYR